MDLARPACALALLTACASILPGCVATPEWRRRPSAPARPEAAPSSVHAQAGYQVPVAGTGPAILEPQARRFPSGGWWTDEFRTWMAPERQAQGYAIVLPGIEGTSGFNLSVARGLLDSGYPGAVDVVDWTTGYWPLFLYHLASRDRNEQQARAIAQRIVTYRQNYPGRPVFLIGHSGGGALTVLTLEQLPAEHSVTRAVLLGAAIDPGHDLTSALSHTEQGLCNVYSPLDFFFLEAGTMAFGTVDRTHALSAGAVGFHTPENLSDAGRALYEERLSQLPYSMRMMRHGNFGGHLGYVSRGFVKHWIAPLLAGSDLP